MADQRALAEAVRYLRDRGENDGADRLANAELGPTPEPEHAPRMLVEDEDEARQQAASSVAWKAITPARARAGRPIE